MSLKTIALLGPTASGKTALSIELALLYGAIILSLDSLSIYKEIDIASAKPSLQERSGVTHFGMDALLPNEHFDVTMFFSLYHEAKTYAKMHRKHLIIVGGTGFYLKAMMEGLSLRPELSLHVITKVQEYLTSQETAYALIQQHDPAYAQKIATSDRYRIQKWLELFLSSTTVPSLYLAQHKQEPILGNVPLFEIETPKEQLIERVKLRTSTMFKQGLIDEVYGLEKCYSRAPQCMKAIGIKEVLDFFDGRYSRAEVEEKIVTNTLHLAKRQRTFNTSQFPTHPKAILSELSPLLHHALKEF